MLHRAPCQRGLRSAWLSNSREYIGAAVGADAADEFFADESSLRIFVWAAAHEGCSLHTPHVHQESAVSGVFYVSVPPLSGPISFDDPRGMRPPFAANRLVHYPSAGELLLFPPWIVHGFVENKAGMAGQPRLAEARGSLGHDLALEEASGEPAGRRL